MKYHNIPTLFDNQASLINGKNIGTDSVRYIQDAGQKTAGTTYIDKNTNELYVCVTTTNSVNNDSNFSKFNLKEAFNKLDSLISNNELVLLSDYNKFHEVNFVEDIILNEDYKNFRMLMICMDNHNSINRWVETFLIPVCDLNVSVREASGPYEGHFDGLIVNFTKSKGNRLNITYWDTALYSIYGYIRIN